MKYWFKLSESSDRKEAIKRGETPSPITLYPETKAIVDDFQDNELSDWWAVYKWGSSNKAGEFDTKEEAEKAYYSNESEDIYCEIHDC